MKVSADYYNKDTFDRPEVVKRIVTWCSKQEAAARVAGDRTSELMAKRIKSLCLKNYKLMRNSSIRFCREWEEHPENMFAWLMTQVPYGKCKIVRIYKDADFSPNNIVLRHT